MTSVSTHQDGYFPSVPDLTHHSNETTISVADNDPLATPGTTASKHVEGSSFHTEQSISVTEDEKNRSYIAVLKSKIDGARDEHDRVVCASRRLGGFAYSQLQRTIECSLRLLPTARTDTKWAKDLSGEVIRLLWEEHKPYLSTAVTYDDFSRTQHAEYQSDGATDQSKVVKMLEAELAELTDKLKSEREINSRLCARGQELSVYRQKLENTTNNMGSDICAVMSENLEA